jgi:hypothetical protein
MGNYLEQLVAEWYEYQEYFVRQNVLVGPRPKGGYEGELDVVAFHPGKSHLVHIECSMDADSWSERNIRMKRKFETGDKYVPDLFHGLTKGIQLEKRVIFGLGSKKTHQHVAGVPITLIDDLILEILDKFKGTSWYSKAVPENLPILRTLQIVGEFQGRLFPKSDKPAKLVELGKTNKRA